MNIRKLKYGLGIVAMAIVAATTMPSCTDERFDLPDYTVSGEDVTISVPIHFPEMDKKTRASFDNPNDLNRVESLWIRTYSADTGVATSDWLKLTPGTTDTEVPHNVTLTTKSGSSYIVGVANVENMGVTSDDLTTQKTLSELLADADRWEDFLKIAVVSPYSRSQNGVNGNVFLPDAPLPMAGCYTNIQVGTHATNPADWQTNDFTPYFIPAQKGTFDLTDGAIHLRRLVSHLTFNIIPGSDAFDLTVDSYQIMNAPKYSWLYERSEKQGAANFGDLATEETSGDYYYDVPQFGSNYPQAGKVTVNGVEKDCISFDYWQGENKHTGTSTTYKDRDKYTGTGDDKLFTSLTGDTWTTNNEATYLLISCTLDYKSQMTVGSQGQQPGQNPVDDKESFDVYRTAQATYLVHLGYVGEGSEEEKSKDFNCFRNVNYTYNITVNGVNDIRVDAWKEDEYPGEEGMVSDLQYATIELDAHYNVFNIQLTEEELSDPNFGFIITTYESGNMITLSDANIQRTLNVSDKEILELGSTTAVIPAKYYNWIELRPTDGPNVLAEYKPRYGTNSDGKTFLLTDLKGGWNAMTGNMKSTSGWYTVFVNEYTYEPMYTGGADGYGDERWDGTGDNPNWMGYVNQNPRRFYIRVTKSTSEDGNSVYSRSKYGISQNSIQTYYSALVVTEADGDIPAGTAIGIERVNETEGLNMRSNYGGGSDPDNGRWNVAQYLSRQTYDDNDLNINKSENQRRRWDEFLDPTAPLQIPAVVGQRAQNGPPLPARMIDAANPANSNPVKLPKFVTFNGTRQAAFNDPQGSSDGNYYVEVMNACTNRNRDNNGNGRIDPDELRWYVPAMGKYLRMILGSHSLGSTPVMNYEQISPGLPMVNADENAWSSAAAGGQIKNGCCTRYFFAGSNRFESSDNVQVLWGMEGLSTSGWREYSGDPWQVRCIRNLGSDLTSVTKGHKVVMAYVPSTEERIVRMTYYDDESIRRNKYSGNGNGAGQMPVHIITSDYNKVYRAFEYADRDISITGTNGELNRLPNFINNDYNDNPCNRLGQDWRVPNQKELTILRNLGIFEGRGTWDVMVSCTASYFNSGDGIGGVYKDYRNYLLGVIPSRGYMIGSGGTFFIRCVRDVD